MTRYAQMVGIGLIVLAVIGIALWWEISLWSECRSDHSFFYCLRVLGK